jgi:hypothetical protein
MRTNATMTYTVTFRDVTDGLFFDREIEADSDDDAIRAAEEYRKRNIIIPDDTEIWAISGKPYGIIHSSN